MSQILTQALGHWDYTLLLFLRVSSILLPSPIFGRKLVPSLIKTSFCIFLTYLFLLAFPFPEQGLVYETTLGYILLCVRELAFGFVLSFVVTMFFDLVYIAGHLIDTQVGFGIVSVYDIQNNSQVPMTGNLLNVVYLIVFFSVNGHLKWISILYSTFAKVPVGHVQISANLASAAVEAFSLSFLLAVMMAMPIIASGLILELAMGVMIRSVPQMNMFVIGIPVKILVCLLVLILTVPAMVAFSNTVFTDMFQSVERLFDTFGVLQ
ncbi:flagellar biosynthetic protein FliR [Papillibacter cinnamivorans]|uniref:Flagellar biosynthetic protein FliR n=1 Tax=Papillibacter cinnamivorans DSM 12816 TaxID=1122930 RepID=A0A1W1YGU8_9FIRM|nr:flagellar biosynthetic protein FliR [Papillibacter cinnamivorans]SMC35417.1 flagellar biosynthetic protein FliR [Papillibacter cinnamivorans DSM 12816]